ncbi:MAG: pilin [Patescibacteria group bacterium]
MKKKLIVLSGFALGFAPFVALAQAQTGGTPRVCNASTITDIQSVLCKIAEILSAILPVLVALGVVYFVWGVISYVVGGDEEAKKKGREKIIYGIIGLAVILSVWGLVRILTNTFGLTNRQQITLPTAPY